MGVNMSTDLYIRRTKPILTFPEFEVARRSGGATRISDRGDTLWYFEDDSRPVARSIDDLVRIVDSGEWELIDEYDEPVDPRELKDA